MLPSQQIACSIKVRETSTISTSISTLLSFVKHILSGNSLHIMHELAVGRGRELHLMPISCLLLLFSSHAKLVLTFFWASHGLWTRYVGGCFITLGETLHHPEFPVRGSFGRASREVAARSALLFSYCKMPRFWNAPQIK